jgi:hypothetical protein
VREQAPTFKDVQLRAPHLVGREAKEMYRLLEPGVDLVCTREPENSADDKAVLVGEFLNEDLVQIAYIQRPINRAVAEWMDRGWIYMAKTTVLKKRTIGRYICAVWFADVYPIGGPREKTTERPKELENEPA